MRKLQTSSLILLLLLAGTSFALADNQSEKPLQTVTLRDGTTLRGALTGVSGETYSIQTPSMGTVTVKAEDIVSITAANATPVSGAAPLSSAINAPSSLPTLNGNNMGQVQAMSQEFLKDPSISASAQDIMNDKELMTLLQDKNLFAAISSSNPQEIQNNPTVQKLLQDPKVKNMMDQIMKKMGSSGGANTLMPTTGN